MSFHRWKVLFIIKKRKKQYRFLRFFYAAGRTRTGTMLPPPDFESGASANSATAAFSYSFILSFLYVDVNKKFNKNEFCFNINGISDQSILASKNKL